VALLTHNPPYVTEFYRRTFGFDDVEGVANQPILDGVLGLPRNVRANKLGGLKSLLDRAQLSPSAVVHVGDGWSDAEVFRAVGGGVALNSTLPEVELAADRIVKTRDFGDVVAVLDDLLPRR